MWLIVVNALALRGGHWGRGLAGLGILAGTLTAVIPPAAGVVLPLWLGWLGVMLIAGRLDGAATEVPRATAPTTAEG